MKNQAKRTYITCGIWHLGGRKKQKVGFLPTLESPAKPLLVSAASAVGGEILKRLRSKISSREKRRSKGRRRKIGPRQQRIRRKGPRNQRRRR